MAGTYLWRLTPSGLAQVPVDQVRATIGAFGSIAPLVYVAVPTLSVLLPPVPDADLVVVGGLSFGLAPATLYALLGGVWARVSISGWRADLGAHGSGALGPRREACRMVGWLAVFLTRLLPGFNFDLVSYAAGPTATLAGMVFPVLNLVVAGDWAGERPEIVTLAAADSVGTMAILLTIAWTLLLIGSRGNVVSGHDAGGSTGRGRRGGPNARLERV